MFPFLNVLQSEENMHNHLKQRLRKHTHVICAGKCPTLLGRFAQKHQLGRRVLEKDKACVINRK